MTFFLRRMTRVNSYPQNLQSGQPHLVASPRDSGRSYLDKLHRLPDGLDNQELLRV